jgi:hypothetical protein
MGTLGDPLTKRNDTWRQMPTTHTHHVRSMTMNDDCVMMRSNRQPIHRPAMSGLVCVGIMRKRKQTNGRTDHMRGGRWRGIVVRWRSLRACTGLGHRSSPSPTPPSLSLCAGGKKTHRAPHADRVAVLRTRDRQQVVDESVERLFAITRVGGKIHDHNPTRGLTGVLCCLYCYSFPALPNCCCQMLLVRRVPLPLASASSPCALHCPLRTASSPRRTEL